jgi:hypothetical protein
MNPEDIGVMIPLAAVILGLAIPIVGMSLEYRMKKDLFELHHKERMAGIEKGIDIPPLPPDLFRSRKRQPTSPGSLLRNGLILVLGGIGLILALSRAMESLSLWGLIPVGIGLAYLISFLYERKQPPAPEAGAANSRDLR